MRRGRSVHRALVAVALVLAGACAASPVTAQPTLQDFGHQSRTVNGTLPLGSRPLLVLIASFEGQTAIARSASYFDSLVFQFFIPRSVNGYFLENSSDRFFWSRTSYGVVGPVTFTAAEQEANQMDNPAGISYVFREIVQRQGLNLSGFDGNADGRVTDEELGILIIHNQGNSLGGATRPIDPSGCVTPSGSSVQICGGSNRVTTVGNLTSFTTLCHELAHQLRALDLYGPQNPCYSMNLTLMSCTISLTPELMDTYHLDPWHKMQFGWVEPRIRSLWAGGIESLPAAQYEADDGPVILYDPQRGASEFFLLEYRTPTSPLGPGYDQDAADYGLAIWHIQQNAAHDPVLLTPNTYALYAEGVPTLVPGGTNLWGGGPPNTTPRLKWFDGTETRTTVTVHPMSIGDASIVVEWLTDDEAWADFNFTGSPELGTFANPYRTLSAGVAGAPRGGVLRIKASASSELFTTGKPMRIESYGGVATLGQ
jgi:M6 family metalloprotease-like protein